MLQAIGSKTASDKANKGVMLVKTNGSSAGEPAGYVTKEVLAEIVRQELFSILSNDGSAATTLSKFIGLDGSSMKSITAGDLASVLGGVRYKKAVDSSDNIDEMREQGSYTMNGVSSQPANFPDSTIASCVIIVFICYNWNVQLVISATKFIYRFGTSASWSPWQNLKQVG